MSQALRAVPRGTARSALRRATRAGRLPAIAGLLLVVSVVATGLGPAAVDPWTVARILLSGLGVPLEATWSDTAATIVLDLRVPRVVLGILAGAALAAVGATLQAIVRNPLADPYVLGVTAGASTGAAAAILLGTGVLAGSAGLGLSAFAGAIVATVAMLALGHLGGRASATRLLLAGITVGYLLPAATSLLVFASDAPEGARAVMFWLLGSLALGSAGTLPVLAVTVVLGLGGLVAAGRVVDALALGDEVAANLGIDPVRARRRLLVLCAALVGATVAAVGGIGFVGLVVPHLARRIVGASHRVLLPATALLGAAVLVASDVAARLLLPPRELPIGIVTALVGTPLLITHVARLRDTP